MRTKLPELIPTRYTVMLTSSNPQDRRVANAWIEGYETALQEVENAYNNDTLFNKVQTVMHMTRILEDLANQVKT